MMRRNPYGTWKGTLADSGALYWRVEISPQEAYSVHLYPNNTWLATALQDGEISLDEDGAGSSRKETWKAAVEALHTVAPNLTFPDPRAYRTEAQVDAGMKAKRDAATKARRAQEQAYQVPPGEYPELLAPPGEAGQRYGAETVEEPPPHDGVAVYRSPKYKGGGYVRFVYFLEGAPAAGLTILANRPWRGKQSGVIDTVYTQENYRRQGLARALLQYAREYLGGKIKHSKELTTMGKAWRTTVNPKPRTHDQDWHLMEPYANVSELQQISEAEGLEATNPRDAAEMLAWDMGYQNERMQAWFTKLGADLQIDVEKHWREGREAAADDPYSNPSAARWNPSHIESLTSLAEQGDGDLEDFYSKSAYGTVRKELEDQGYTAYHGRNVIWMGEEGRMLRVDPDYAQHIWGNIFYADKLSAVVQGVERGDVEGDRVVFFAPYAQVTQIDPDDVQESLQGHERGDDEGLERAYTTGNEMLDLWLVDPEEAFEEYGWEYEDEGGDEDPAVFETLMEREMALAVEDGDGDLGEWVYQIRDGNHRAFGALLAGEPHIYVFLGSDDYSRLIRAQRNGTLTVEEAKLLEMLE